MAIYGKKILKGNGLEKIMIGYQSRIPNPCLKYTGLKLIFTPLPFERLQPGMQRNTNCQIFSECNAHLQFLSIVMIISAFLASKKITVNKNAC